MAKRAKTIEDLLSEREQFELWLARLDESSDLASDSVRAKVRSDYQERLEAVIIELGSHSDSIADQLADHRGNQADLTAREASAREELAEAEVRHAVGEYDDDEWKKLKDMADDQIEQIAGELKDVTSEIDRLAGVQALIASRPEVTGEPDSGSTATTEAEPQMDDQEPVISISGSAGGDDPSMGAPKFTPRGADARGESSAPRTLRFPGGESGGGSLDELDFLKSVTEDESSGPSPEGAEAAAAQAASEAAREVATSTDAQSGGPSQAKTLKCGECGELNRPTEWYCERCGAELASL